MDDNRHIFLSYRSTEVDFALQLAADLKNAGVNLWMDRLDIRPGDDWRNALQGAVSGCAAMIAVLSPEYVKSRYCKRELARADRVGRPIFPVLLTAVTETDWPLEIEREQYIDFSDWRDEQAYSKQLRRLVAILKERFSAQFSVVPDPETRYLTNLLAEIEAHKGLIELLELPGEASKGPNHDLIRPEPRFAQVWASHGNFALVQDSPVTDYPPDSPRRRKIALKQIREILTRFSRFVLIGEPGTGKTTTLHSLVLDAVYARRADPLNAPLPLLLKLINWQDDTTPAEFIRASWPLDTDPIKLMEKGKAVLYLDGLSELGQASPAKAELLREWLNSANAPQYVIVTCRTADYYGDLDLGLPMIQTCEMEQAYVEQFVTDYLGYEAAQILLQRILPQNDDDRGDVQPLYPLARNPFLLSAIMLIYKDSAASHLPYTAGMLLKRLAAEMWEREQGRQTVTTVSFPDVETGLADLAFEMIEAEMPIYVPVDYALEYVGNQTILHAAQSVGFIQIVGQQVRFSYQFMHDYFAALRLMDLGVAKRMSQPKLDVCGQRIESRWDRVIVVLSGMISNPDSTIWTIAEVDPFLALSCIASGTNVSKETLQRIIDHLLNMMRAQGQDGRVATARILANIDLESALQILLETLRDGTWEIRRAALWVLWEIEISPLLGLTQILQELADDIREATVIALRQLGEMALPTLLKLLQDEQWMSRRSAAWALGELKDLAGVPGLVETLYDADTLVGTEAAIALGQIRDSEAVPWLLRMLYHDNWRVRNAAAKALGSIGKPALDGLLDALRDENDEVRRLAIGALKMIDDEATTTALLETSYDENVEIRSAALEALKDMEDPRILKRLIECLSDTAKARWNRQRVCDAAARALEAIGTPDALRALGEWRKGEKIAKKRETLRASKRSDVVVRAVGNSTKPSGSNGGGKSAKIGKDRLKQLHKEARDKGEAQEPDAPTEAEVNSSNDLAQHITALEDDHIQTRIDAVKALAKIETDAAVEALIQALGDDDFLVIDTAASTLEMIGKRAVPVLLNALETEKTDIRGSVVEILGEIADISAIPALIKCLSDTRKPWLSDERICDMAAKALESIRTPDALRAVRKWRASVEHSVPPRPVTKDSILIAQQKPVDANQNPEKHRQIIYELLQTLHHEDWAVRQDAAKALREYAKILNGTKDPIAIQRLLNALDDGDMNVRWAAIEALAWIGDATAVPRLVELGRDSNWTVRIAVIRALLEIGDHTAIEGIMKGLTDSSGMVREAAAEALGGFGATVAVPGLSHLLRDKEELVRLAATVALGKIDDPAVPQLLLRALHDQDCNVRWAAADALTKTTDEVVVPDLIKHLQDTEGPYWEDKRICDLVAEALEHIGTPEAKTAVEKWRREQPNKQN